ncbi:MAG: asparagine synthase (glutamine-hydrolyzing), partial [Mycobacteriaceae bacterium]
MCGIAGYIGDERPAHAGLTTALKTLHHRGPNDQGTHASGPVSMGMTRLSIIDIEGGHQPMYSEDGTIAVVFNGEIYNYRELADQLRGQGHTLTTSSDTEVLVHLYERHGPDMVQLLRGMFAFAIHDSRSRSVFLARDGFGKKPLYYRHHGHELWFASEIKALRSWARASAHGLQVDPQSVYDYLSLGVVPQPSTIYREIHALPPGSHARFANGSMTIQQYWSPTFSPKIQLSLPDALAETRRLVKEAVELRLRSDVPLGVFLSGGVDSSIITYEAGKALGGDLDTFTVSTGGDLDESGQAELTARSLGVRNTRLGLTMDAVDGVHSVVAHYDQPYGDSSAIPSLQISRLAAEHVSVVLNGDGGDEMF